MQARSGLLVRSALVALWLLACADSTGLEVVSVTVSPGSSTIMVGQAQQYSATLWNANGKTVPGRAIAWLEWRSTHPDVATVDADGLVKGLRAGTATIRATSGGLSGNAKIIIAPLPIASLAIKARAPSVLERHTLKLSAMAYDSTGRELTGRAFSWKALDAKVATVDDTGLVTAVAPGRARIAANSGGKSSLATSSSLRQT